MGGGRNVKYGGDARTSRAYSNYEVTNMARRRVVCIYDTRNDSTCDDTTKEFGLRLTN